MNIICKDWWDEDTYNVLVTNYPEIGGREKRAIVIRFTKEQLSGLPLVEEGCKAPEVEIKYDWRHL